MGIPARLLRQKAIWREPGSTTDTRGDDVVDWDNPTVEQPVRVRIEQLPFGVGEVSDDRQAVFSQWRLYTNETRITPAGRIELDARSYDVIGHPWVVPDGRGRPHHLEALLRIVEG